MTESNESLPYAAPFVSIVQNKPYLFVRIPDGYELHEKSRTIASIIYELRSEISPKFRDQIMELPQFGTINIKSSAGSVQKTAQLNSRETTSVETPINHTEHPFIYVDVDSDDEWIVYFVSVVPAPSKWKMNHANSLRFELNLKDGMIIDDNDKLDLFTFKTEIQRSSIEDTKSAEFVVARGQADDPEKKKKLIVNTSNGSVGEGDDDK